MESKRIKIVRELVDLIKDYNKLLNKDYKAQKVLVGKIKKRQIKVKKWCDSNLDKIEHNEGVRSRKLIGEEHSQKGKYTKNDM